MPLIIVTGLPSSGKSCLAVDIAKELKNRLDAKGQKRHVKIVSDGEQLDWEGRSTIYSSIAKEKELRSWLRAEAQRFVNLNQIVVLDAAIYIKGFRYELFCMSKEAKTQYCVVEKLIPSEVCWKWNEELISQHTEESDGDAPEPGYSRQIFDALLMRYEKCDENNRWDSPLFRIDSEVDKLDYDELYRVVVEEKPLVPNKCTSLTQTTSTIFKPSQ